LPEEPWHLDRYGIFPLYQEETSLN
jgi:hypothetical protein